jgi:hypothetical protein
MIKFVYGNNIEVNFVTTALVNCTLKREKKESLKMPRAAN